MSLAISTITSTLAILLTAALVGLSSAQLEYSEYPVRKNEQSYNWTCRCDGPHDRSNDPYGEEEFDFTRIWETPTSGVYLVSLLVDQNGETNTNDMCPAAQLSREAEKCNGSPVQIRIGKKHFILSTHTGNHTHPTFGDVTVSLTLKKGSLVVIDGCCARLHIRSHVYIVLVSRFEGGHAFTRQVPTPVSNSRSTLRDYHYLEAVQFNKIMTHHAFPSRQDSHFVVPVSGIYWVTLRAHVSSYIPYGLRARMAVYVDTYYELLMAECDSVNQGTGSAAFWLGHKSVLTVRMKNLQQLGSDTRLEPREASSQTVFSATYLGGNHLQNDAFEMRYAAFTGLSDFEGSLSLREGSISFRNTLTDFGDLYSEEYRYVVIQTPGIYLVSVRAVPSVGTNRTRLVVTLYNGQQVAVYPQGRVATAHTFAEELAAGDVVAVYADVHSYVEKLTMLSVALVQLNEPRNLECGTETTRPCPWN